MIQTVMPKVYLPQKQLTLEAVTGENLLTFLQAQQIPVASSCLGDGICSMCKMKVVGTLVEALELEKNTLARNKASASERLSCQISINHDLEVTTKYW